MRWPAAPDLTGFVPMPDATLTGWGGDDPILARWVADCAADAETVVEVGCWRGLSTITLAQAAPRATLWCVDTWLGSDEFWLGTEAGQPAWDLRLRHGYPRVYDEWLTNLAAAGLTDRVRPMPMPSGQAARVFERLGQRADLVYVDGSHDSEDVRADLIAWRRVLTPSGWLMGDDYDHARFPAVRHWVDTLLTDVTAERRFWRGR